MNRYWRDRALCRLDTSGLWNPPEGREIADGRFDHRWRQAAAICHACPVVAECVRAGRDTGGSGIFGGLLLEDGKVITPPRPVGRPKQGAA